MAHHRREEAGVETNVTQAVVHAVGCPQQAVEIMIFEVDQANWAQGGVCHADRSPHQPQT